MLFFPPQWDNTRDTHETDRSEINRKEGHKLWISGKIQILSIQFKMEHKLLLFFRTDNTEETDHHEKTTQNLNGLKLRISGKIQILSIKFNYSIQNRTYITASFVFFPFCNRVD